MKKIKLSIIVPVYNVEKYLKQCIDSIINQKLSNIEVILVDDGSTDESGKICDYYSDEYSYITTIHQKNKGLSGARNTGIKNSSGEFLMFVDSDDYINPKVDLKKIIESLKNDITQYKWVYYYDDKDKYVYFPDMKLYETTNISQMLFDKALDGSFSVSACDKIVKKDIIEKKEIYFKEGIYSEDMDWTFRLYQEINTYSILNEDVYIYRQSRKGSITNKIKKKNIEDLYSIINYWFKYDYKEDLIKNAYLNYLAYHYVILITLINKSNCDKEMKKKIYALDGIMNYSNNKKVKMCKNLFKFTGRIIGLKILKMYIYLKDLGIVKI